MDWCMGKGSSGGEKGLWRGDGSVESWLPYIDIILTICCWVIGGLVEVVMHMSII